MSFYENLFGKIMGWGQDKIRDRNRRVSAQFDDHIKSVAVLFHSMQSNSRLLLRKECGIGTLGQDEVFFPDSIDIFPSPELNRRALLHKALASALILERGSHYSNPSSQFSRNQWSAFEEFLHLRKSADADSPDITPITQTYLMRLRLDPTDQTPRVEGSRT